MKTHRAFGTILLVLTLIGCTAEASREPATPPPAAPESTAMPTPSAADAAAVTAQLAAADAVDGETDMVVTRCAGCKLGMNGKADHALELEGYSLHFCSDHCQEGFAEDTVAKVMALKIPSK